MRSPPSRIGGDPYSPTHHTGDAVPCRPPFQQQALVPQGLDERSYITGGLEKVGKLVELDSSIVSTPPRRHCARAASWSR